jgi:hypothetical protein
MRRQRAGRIVNISSVMGLIPAPYMALYASSKHALEGYSESLDHEIRDADTRVVLVEPAYTRTSSESNLVQADQQLEEYKSARSNAEAVMRDVMKNAEALPNAGSIALHYSVGHKPIGIYEGVASNCVLRDVGCPGTAACPPIHRVANRRPPAVDAGGSRFRHAAPPRRTRVLGIQAGDPRHLSFECLGLLCEATLQRPSLGRDRFTLWPIAK